MRVACRPIGPGRISNRTAEPFDGGNRRSRRNRLRGRRTAAREQVSCRRLATGSGCDVVVLVLPLTEDTRGVFRREVFSAFKPKAHLINVGRGGVVNESDLLSALDDGALARVSLDVFAQEPLSADHPFWRHPRVILTPHVCGPLIPEDIAPHFIANVKAFLENRPLNHLVDVARQY